MECVQTDGATGMKNRCVTRGTGAWTRSEEGKWELEIFAVQDFEPIEDRSLIEAFAALQAVEGSGWKKMNDPLATWQQLRSH